MLCRSPQSVPLLQPPPSLPLSTTTLPAIKLIQSLGVSDNQVLGCWWVGRQLQPWTSAGCYPCSAAGGWGPPLPLSQPPVFPPAPPCWLLLSAPPPTLAWCGCFGSMGLLPPAGCCPCSAGFGMWLQAFKDPFQDGGCCPCSADFGKRPQDFKDL